MWTEDCLYRGATKEYIVHGLATSLDHLRAIGLGDASFESKLVSLQGRVSAMLEIDLTAEMRRLLGIDIAALKVRLGECIQTENSPGCQTDGPGDRVPQKQ
jgi:hypothetical protein